MSAYRGQCLNHDLYDYGDAMRDNHSTFPVHNGRLLAEDTVTAPIEEASISAPGIIPIKTITQIVVQTNGARKESCRGGEDLRTEGG